MTEIMAIFLFHLRDKMESQRTLSDLLHLFAPLVGETFFEPRKVWKDPRKVSRKSCECLDGGGTKCMAPSVKMRGLCKVDMCQYHIIMCSKSHHLYKKAGFLSKKEDQSPTKKIMYKSIESVLRLFHNLFLYPTMDSGHAIFLSRLLTEILSPAIITLQVRSYSYQSNAVYTMKQLFSSSTIKKIFQYLLKVVLEKRDYYCTTIIFLNEDLYLRPIDIMTTCIRGIEQSALKEHIKDFSCSQLLRNTMDRQKLYKFN